MPSVGEQLGAARERAGLSIDEAADTTRVRRQHLVAMEADNFTALPGDTFARGFIRIYASALGLDSEPLIAAYIEQTGLLAPDYAIPTPAVGGGPARRLPGTLIGVGVVVALLLLTIALCSRPSGETPQPAGAATATAPAGQAGDTVRAEAQFVITAVASAFLEIRVDGQTVFEGTVNAGTQQRWSPKQSLSIRTDNGAAIEVVIDQQTIGTLGLPGQQIERVWTVGA